MDDFDRRLDAMDKKIKDQEFVNGQVENKLNDHDESIRKILNDIKLLKMTRPKNDTPDKDAGPADTGVGAD